jgi:hypothetical protein
MSLDVGLPSMTYDRAKTLPVYPVRGTSQTINEQQCAAKHVMTNRPFVFFRSAVSTIVTLSSFDSMPNKYALNKRSKQPVHRLQHRVSPDHASGAFDTHWMSNPNFLVNHSFDIGLRGRSL